MQLQMVVLGVSMRPLIVVFCFVDVDLSSKQKVERQQYISTGFDKTEKHQTHRVTTKHKGYTSHSLSPEMRGRSENVFDEKKVEKKSATLCPELTD